MTPAWPRLTEGMSGDRGHERRRPSERAGDPDLAHGDAPTDLDQAALRGVVTKAAGVRPVHNANSRIDGRGHEVDPKVFMIVRR
jgi:hypothetical protein